MAWHLKRTDSEFFLGAREAGSPNRPKKAPGPQHPKLADQVAEDDRAVAGYPSPLIRSPRRPGWSVGQRTNHITSVLSEAAKIGRWFVGGLEFIRHGGNDEASFGTPNDGSLPLVRQANLLTYDFLF